MKSYLFNKALLLMALGLGDALAFKNADEYLEHFKALQESLFAKNENTDFSQIKDIKDKKIAEILTLKNQYDYTQNPGLYNVVREISKKICGDGLMKKYMNKDSIRQNSGAFCSDKRIQALAVYYCTENLGENIRSNRYHFKWIGDFGSSHCYQKMNDIVRMRQIDTTGLKNP